MGWTGNNKDLQDWYSGDETTTINEAYRGEDNSSDDDAYTATKCTCEDAELGDEEDEPEAAGTGVRKSHKAAGLMVRPLATGASSARSAPGPSEQPHSTTKPHQSRGSVPT